MANKEIRIYRWVIRKLKFFMGLIRNLPKNQLLLEDCSNDIVSDQKRTPVPLDIKSSGVLTSFAQASPASRVTGRDRSCIVDCTRTFFSTTS